MYSRRQYKIMSSSKDIRYEYTCGNCGETFLFSPHAKTEDWESQFCDLNCAKAAGQAQ
jgi:hypothetical protein